MVDVSENIDKNSVSISDTQRSGSITGIGIVLGFSLAFIAQWSLLPGPWQILQFIALLISIFGVVLQLLALIQVLYLAPVSLGTHNRMIKRFVYGVCSMLLGFWAHLSIDFWIR